MHTRLIGFSFALGFCLTQGAEARAEAIRPLQLLGSQRITSFAYGRAEGACLTRDGGVVIAVWSGIEKLNGPLSGSELAPAWSLEIPDFSPRSIKQLPDGALVCGGVDTSVGQFGLVWISSTGQLQKRMRYGGQPVHVPGYFSSDAAFDLQITPEGEFLLTGITVTGPGNDKASPAYGVADGWALLVGSDGRMKWEHAFGGSAYDILVRGARTKDGGYAFAGFSGSQVSGNKTTSSSGGDFWLVKADHFGNPQWDKTFNFGDGDMLQTFIIAANGDFVLAGGGQRPGNGSPIDGALVRVASDGQLIWQRTIRLNATRISMVTCLVELPDGKLLVQLHDGTSPNGFRSNVRIRCLSADGGDLWQTSYSGYSEFSGALLTGPSGEIVSFSNYLASGIEVSGFQCVRYAPESVLNRSALPRLFPIPEFFQTETQPQMLSLVGPTNIPIVLQQSADFVAWVSYATNILSNKDSKVAMPQRPGVPAAFIRASIAE